MKKLRDSASQGEKKSLEDEEGRKKFGGLGSPASSKSMELINFYFQRLKIDKERHWMIEITKRLREANQKMILWGQHRPGAALQRQDQTSRWKSFR